MENIHRYIWKKSSQNNEKRNKQFENNHFNNVEVVKDIQYGDNQNLSFDLYTPEFLHAPLPIIINVHGGGYASGDKNVNRLVSEFWASKGFCVVTPNYTLLDEGKFPTALYDIFTLFNFISKKFNHNFYDFNNVFIAGDSAGAHITSLAVCILNNYQLQIDFNLFSKFKIRACAFSSGMFNIANFNNFKPLANVYKKIILGDDYKNNLLTNLYSTLDLVDDNFPPTFCVCGSNDIAKPHNIAFSKKLKELNIESILFVQPGESHDFNITNPLKETSLNYNNKILDFFSEHLFIANKQNINNNENNLNK